MPGLLESPGELARQLHRQIATRTVVVAGDFLTTHLGALGGRPGCVVAAGTGAIVLGTDHRTIWNRVDGWGHLLGDEGGGSWIGAQGLRAALRHGDGRDGGSEALHRELRHRFGDADRALGAIYGSESPAHELAAFAPAVARAAHDGDPVAGRIWHRAGVHLAEAAHAASGGLPAEFSWGGRLFDAGPLLLAPFREELARRVPGARLSSPDGQAVDGALLLARRGLPADRSDHLPYAREFTTDAAASPRPPVTRQPDRSQGPETPPVRWSVRVARFAWRRRCAPPPSHGRTQEVSAPVANPAGTSVRVFCRVGTVERGRTYLGSDDSGSPNVRDPQGVSLGLWTSNPCRPAARTGYAAVVTDGTVTGDKLPLRAKVASTVSRTAAALSRATGRGDGSVIGGRIGLMIDPDLLANLAAGRRIALVSGTNGKTTTTRLTTAALGVLGPVATNSFGANMPTGHTSALAKAGRTPYAVLEVDEHYLPQVLADTRPMTVALL